VCPVVERGAMSRSIYLPAGSDWYDFWTGKCVSGGQVIETDASLPKMPLFVRAGSILPLGPIVQHTGEALDAPLEIRVYGGRDGAFDLYEDEGDNYNFERGERTITPLRWSDHEHRLQIGPRDGTFTGMPRRREFRITRVVEGRAGGMELVDKPDHVVICENPFEGEAVWR